LSLSYRPYFIIFEVSLTDPVRLNQRGITTHIISLFVPVNQDFLCAKTTPGTASEVRDPGALAGGQRAGSAFSKRPLPIANLRQVVAVTRHVLFMLDKLVAQPLLEVGSPRL
jgi:hypothetical protein